VRLRSLLSAVCYLLSAVCTGQWFEASIVVPGRPTRVLYNPETDRVYCSCWESDLIAVADGATNHLVKSLPTGTMPWDLCLGPAGKLYCGNLGDTFLTVVDADSDAVMGSVQGVLAAYQLRYNPFNNRVYGTTWGSGVYVVDCGGDTVTSILAIDSAHGHLFYNTSENDLYVPSTGVAVVDCETDSVVAQVPFVPFGYVHCGMCLSRGQGKLYCAGWRDNSVGVIDVQTYALLAQVPVDSEPFSLCWNATEDKVYCANNNGNTIAVIDATSDSIVRRIPVPGGPSVLCLDSANNKLYCGTQGTGSVVVVDCSTDAILTTIDLGGMIMDMAWSHRFGRVYVANRDSCNIAVIRDSVPGGVQETTHAVGGSTDLGSAIVRGTLLLPGAAGSERPAGSACLLDISGRKVLDLHAGANDVSGIAPGVYFVRRQGSRARGFVDSTADKTVITK